MLGGGIMYFKIYFFPRQDGQPGFLEKRLQEEVPWSPSGFISYEPIRLRRKPD
jgi:hypothetical protein